jgi:hypothetical protein
LRNWSGGTQADTDADDQASPSAVSKVIFHTTSEIDVTAMAQLQTTLRRLILRSLVGWGLLQSFETKEILAHKHNGLSTDTSVRIEVHDRA